MGEEQVRLAILANDGLGDVTKGRAYKWLEEKAREAKARGLKPLSELARNQ